MFEDRRRDADDDADRRGDIGEDEVMGFVPVDELVRQLVLALGAAMVVGSIAVLVRERRRRARPQDGPKPNMKVVALNLGLGAVLTIWGVASIVAAR
jgi:hypothetical protein